MSITQKLLSFEGRLRRRDWWLFSILISLASFLAAAIVVWLLGARVENQTAGAVFHLTPAGIAAAVIYLVFLWPALALGIKRGHDRNRPAALVVAAYAAVWTNSILAGLATGAGVQPSDIVPGGLGMVVGVLFFAGAIYMLVDLGVLDGNPGPNRYGPSPKAGEPAESFA